MTREEILEYRRREKEFSETALGKAFNKFKNTTIRAWTLDTEDSYTDRNRLSTKQAHEAATIAEERLKDILRRAIIQ